MAKKARGEVSNVLLALLVIFAIWSIYILQSYFLILLEALTLTALIYPMYRKFRRILKKDYLAAATSLAVFGVVGMLLFSFVLGGALSQMIVGLRSIRDGLDAFQSTPDINPRLSQRIDDSRKYISEQIGSFSKELLSYTPSLVGVASTLMTHLMLLLIGTFYLLVDGKKIINSISSFHKDGGKDLSDFLGYTEEIVRTLVVGLVGVSIFKGVSNGISFYLFGVSNPLFWMIVMMILGIIPLVGPFLIWFPAGLGIALMVHPLYGLAIMVWGFISDNVFDNIVYPRMVSNRANIHPLTIIFGIFAGITTYGVIGVILGPVVFTITLAVATIYLKNKRMVWDKKETGKGNHFFQ